MNDRTPLLEVENLTVQYRSRRGAASTAVRDASLRIEAGETVGLVGESGSGKSTLANAVLGMVEVAEGRIRFQGEDVTHAKAGRRRSLSEDLSVVFQDPYSSLNPSRTIGQTLEEPLLVHRHLSRREKSAAVEAALLRVGLPPSAADRYPGAFSGGQRQRISIARALMLSPKLVICDEAVSALDLSVQAQVLNLLRDLQRELSLGYLFISHDLEVVKHVCHRVIVMYRGRVVEEGPADIVCERPQHPYTRMLLEAVPVPDPEDQSRRREDRRERLGAGSTVARASGGATDTGCPFVARCAFATQICKEVMPPMKPIAETDGAVQAACHWLAAQDVAEKEVIA
ncbi:ABC transporter ATP-binding protein [Leifsonia sp. NPDC058230]|uniref:ABC transporter ATP-binding protein n=1 Tax=Leifsonia sp. NPDC058230 TaxID=3346391 RepID=UPI0036D84C9B